MREGSSQQAIMDRMGTCLSNMDAGRINTDHGAFGSRLRRGTSVLSAVALMLAVFLMMASAGCKKPSPGTETDLVPSYGKGSVEVIIFTDYFCPPCQTLEPELEPMLYRLMGKGGVRFTFVDAPVSKHTQLYMKYFLYALNAGADFKEVLRIRHVLFAAAKTNAVFTEEAIASELRAQGIISKPYDLTRVYIQMNELMKRYDIRSTPICFVKYSDKDSRRYAGPEEIKRALSSLLSAPEPVKR
jgi:thiol-disulfide isomerase/thioredoxin